MSTRALPVVGQPEAPRERADAVRNRARILAAARTMLRRMPADALCMDALCAEARVGKGTLYRRFVDKAALLHALLDEDERLLQEDVHASFQGSARGAQARRQLCELLEKLHRFVLEHADLVAAAEASARPSARLASAPYAWRRDLLVILLERTGVTPRLAAEHLAELLIVALSAEVAVRALRRQSAAAVLQQGRAFFEGVVASLGVLSAS
ncbi:MAG: TetR/AcrR family transcriptional regulator [Deltaproteobacteria bacterium]|nr:TetR/AcrR family transcriptional regulator [Deltaproteobacteria bacterium]